MKQKCPSCGSCGMPMQQATDFGSHYPANELCVFCTDESGNLSKTFDEVVHFYTREFVEHRGFDPKKARSVAEAFVSQQPVWKEHGQSQ